jgi:hypothetical protein
MLQCKHFSIATLHFDTTYKWAQTEAGLKEFSQVEATVKGFVGGNEFHVVAEGATQEEALLAALAKGLAPHYQRFSRPILLKGESFTSMMEAILAFDAICS